MLSLINIANGIKEPTTRGYQNYNTCEKLIFGGYAKVRECLYTELLFGSVPF